MIEFDTLDTMPLGLAERQIVESKPMDKIHIVGMLQDPCGMFSQPSVEFKLFDNDERIHGYTFFLPDDGEEIVVKLFEMSMKYAIHLMQLLRKHSWNEHEIFYFVESKNGFTNIDGDIIQMVVSKYRIGEKHEQH